MAGRDFAEADAFPGAPPVALLSHGFWTARFGGDASIVGRTVSVSGAVVTVVGVMPADLPVSRGRRAVRCLAPARHAARCVACRRADDAAERDWPAWRPAFRQPPPLSELLGIYKQAAASLLDDGKPEFSPSDVDRLQLEAGLLQERLAGNVRERLWLAMGAVGFVLLVACANVANLLLARASTRHRELAVRAALGARTGRLVRLLLTESVLLALIGSVLGLLLAVATRGVARMVLAERLPHVDTIEFDWWVLAFTIAVAVGTGMLCGLASIPGATRSA